MLAGSSIDASNKSVSGIEEQLPEAFRVLGGLLVRLASFIGDGQAVMEHLHDVASGGLFSDEDTAERA
jgi:hypothetical protein